MNLWKRLRARMYVLGSHRLWWLMFLVAAVAFAVFRSSFSSPWSWITTFPLVVFASLLVDARSKWRRDEQRERTTGIRRGPFD